MTKWNWPKKKSIDLVEEFFRSRNIQDEDSFLNPSVEQIHSCSLLYDADIAAEIILDYVNNNKKIYIHGDFDVDGVTATAIMWQFLYRDLGADAVPFIPSRFDEGYGLSESSIEKIIENGADLIITVDCGVKDFKIIEKYSDKVKFIVTDHHTLLDQTSNINDKDSSLKKIGNYLVPSGALAVVHPKLSISSLEEENYPFTEICGANVSWKVCHAINNELPEDKQHDLQKYIELTALGTTCDVMPLVDENRAIVKLGLEKMSQTKNSGLSALIELTGIEKDNIQNYHLGYVIGPRINAAGRIDSAMDALRLLSTTSSETAETYARKLNSLNLKRQELTEKYMLIAEEQIEKQKDNDIYIVYGEDWPEGVVGLIAGKLTHKYHRPTLAGSLQEGIIKGSARSIEGFNIADALKSLSTLLERHGGHAGAAGFTIKQENMDKFKKRLLEYVSTNLNTDLLERSVQIDIFADLKISIDEINKLKTLAPFGYGNEEPLVGLKKVKIINPRIVGKNNNHILFGITDGKNSIKGIAFGKAEEFSEIFDSVSEDTEFNLAGYLSVNEWNGNRDVQLSVRELEIASR